MIDHHAGLAHALDEFELAAAVGGQILDQSVRAPSRKSPSISALRPKPLGFLRTYCMGSAMRSAIQAANGMPAVSPPATASMAAKPISRRIVATAKSISVARTCGKEMSLRQSV